MTTKQIIDSHAHLTWDSFAEDQAAVISRAFEQGVVQLVQAGIDLNTMPEMIKIADNYPQIFFGAGIHPHEAQSWGSVAYEALCQAAQHSKMVAFGECGLDYYYNLSDKPVQQQAFREQVKLAKLLGKPLIIHTRDAWEDTFMILEEEGQGKVQGVFHCFTGDKRVLPRINELGFYISFSGILTFKNAQQIQEVAAIAPVDRILLETDCPYLAPVPYRGKRNEPAYIWSTAQKLAELRKVTLEEIANITVANTRCLFALPKS